jgi:hypothetical protein
MNSIGIDLGLTALLAEGKKGTRGEEGKKYSFLFSLPSSWCFYG